MQPTYKSAGVSIEASNELTSLLKNQINSKNIGNFAGIYENPIFTDNFLVACTDGVGTKVIPLVERKLFNSIAKDLIAMNLNDLICVGAKPLFFLDYFATNKLNAEIASSIIIELKNELDKYNCTLLGGETSELGSLIKENCIDVSGFLVGVVKKDELISRSNVKYGDLIIGLKSSGPHSNGFSLIRKLRDEELISKEVFEKMLEPCFIYEKEISKITEKKLAHSYANITGGGIFENLKRAIPDGLRGIVNTEKIIKQEVFEELLKVVGKEEAYKTFNMGIGFCIVAPSENKSEIFEICKKYNPVVIGQVE